MKMVAIIFVVYQPCKTLKFISKSYNCFMSAFFSSIIFFSACRIAYPALFLLRRDMRLVQLLIILPIFVMCVPVCTFMILVY